jgi:LSU ribosomal protein L13P
MAVSGYKVLNKGELPEEGEVVIDASNHIAGRLATVVAKLALQGKAIVIVNAEKAVITGDRNMVINWIKRRMSEIRTHYNPEKVGPKWPRRPDRILRRIIEACYRTSSIGVEPP